MRRIPELLLVTSLAALAGMGCGGRRAAPDAPDVLLVVVDTLRADQLGTYGYPAASSPNLDALAAESAVFERAIAASASTAPSHGSLMTSRWVRDHSIGYFNNSTRLTDQTTVAEIFRNAGYDTAAFIGNAVLRAAIGLNRGFDLYDDELPDRERNRPGFFERAAAGTTERAIAWLERPRERPYFLWVHYQDPHGPYTPPPPWDKGLDVPELDGEQPLPRLQKQTGLRGVPAYQWLPGSQDPRRYRSLYAGEIRSFDDWLGRLVEAAEASAGDRGLILAITADHGESLGEDHFWFAHTHATTPNLAWIPLLIRAPGIAPVRVRELVHHVDVMPTLLSLAGLPVPGTCRGLDLSPRIRGGKPLPERVVFTDIGREASAYSRDGFLRVVERRRIAKPGHGRWTYYRWSRDDVPLAGSRGVGLAWQPDPDGEASAPDARAALERYLELVPPLAPAREPDAAQLERLRVLGYIDPKED